MPRLPDHALTRAEMARPSSPQHRLHMGRAVHTSRKSLSRLHARCRHALPHPCSALPAGQNLLHSALAESKTSSPANTPTRTSTRSAPPCRRTSSTAVPCTSTRRATASVSFSNKASPPAAGVPTRPSRSPTATASPTHSPTHTPASKHPAAPTATSRSHAISSAPPATPPTATAWRPCSTTPSSAHAPFSPTAPASITPTTTTTRTSSGTTTSGPAAPAPSRSSPPTTASAPTSPHRAASPSISITLRASAGSRTARASPSHKQPITQTTARSRSKSLPTAIAPFPSRCASPHGLAPQPAHSSTAAPRQGSLHTPAHGSSWTANGAMATASNSHSTCRFASFRSTPNTPTSSPSCAAPQRCSLYYQRPTHSRAHNS